MGCDSLASPRCTFGREGKGERLTAGGAAGQVFHYRRPFLFQQRVLGEGCQQVRIEVLARGIKGLLS